MYSVDDLLDNIADDDVQSIRSEDEDLNNVEGNQNEGTNVDEEVKRDEDNDDSKKTPKKTRKKSNRAVLNVARLNGPRGLICMERIFSKIKFKGKGYEREDLNTVMNTLQHWSHRLYPKFAFDDTIEQLEKLGTKKPVITMKKKILMNMVDEEVNVKSVSDDEVELLQHIDIPEEQNDPFDTLLNINRSTQPTTEMEITDEMEEIMERNRLLAAERRRAKLEAMKQNASTESNQITTTIEVHHSNESEPQNHSQEKPEEIVEPQEMVNENPTSLDTEEINVDNILDIINDDSNPINE